MRRADIVIVDLMMPVMDGPEMIRQMRSNPDLAKIPTILMTVLPEASPIGADALHDVVLLKPFSLNELLRIMERLLRQERP